MTTPAQIKKNWLTSARTWFGYAERAVRPGDKRKAETKMWESLLRAVSGL